MERRSGADGRIPPDLRPEGWRLELNAALWSTAWELARRLPEPIAFGLGRLLGALWHRLGSKTRGRVRRNLARVVPPAELDTVVRGAFRSYARYWIESFRAADIPPDSVKQRTTSEGFHYLDEALEEGRGVIVLLAHHGSWDVGARWAETTGYHLAVVAEVLRPRALFRKFVRLREAIGLEIIPLVPKAQAGEEGARRSQLGMTARLAEVLAANHFVGLLSDRDLTGTAPVVRFFGEDTRIPKGPVVLSKRTGAPIVPVTILQRPGRHWHVVALPRLDLAERTVADGCQMLADAIEELIRLDPEQWHAFSPVWLIDVPEHRRGDWSPPVAGAQERTA